MATTFERDSVATTLMNHGRADFRRGAEYRQTAGEAWRRGWIEEAQRLSAAAHRPGLAKAMKLVEAQAALDAAQRVLSTCMMDPTRMGKSQQRMMAEAVPLITDALARLAEPTEAQSEAPTKTTNSVTTNSVPG